MAMEVEKRELHILFIKDGDNWTAQCLDYDIAAQGPTIRVAIHRFFSSFYAMIAFDKEHGRQPLQGFPRAPSRFWEAWSEAESLISQAPGSVPPGIDLPPAWMMDKLTPELRVY